MALPSIVVDHRDALVLLLADLAFAGMAFRTEPEGAGWRVTFLL